jgi:hypothetical protein
MSEDRSRILLRSIRATAARTRLASARCVEAAGDHAPGFAARYQAGVRQHVEMLHDRRLRYRTRRGQRAHRNVRLFGEPHHQRSPRRIGKRRERAVEGRALKVNHLV